MIIFRNKTPDTIIMWGSESILAGYEWDYTRDIVNNVNYMEPTAEDLVKIQQFLLSSDLELWINNELVSVENASELLAEMINDPNDFISRNNIGSITKTGDKIGLSVPESTIIYDKSLKKMCFFNGAIWEVLGSSAE